MSLLDVLKSKTEPNRPFLPLDVFLSTVLYDPLYGYYAQSEVFGSGGDYITSPEISQIFGEMLALWVINEWYQFKKPAAFQLVELGPGKGTMMSDMVRIFKKVPELYKTLEIHLIEKNKKLKTFQEEKLQGSFVTWHEDISTLDETKVTFFIANEFFDALPIKQIYKSKEQAVNLEDLSFTLDPSIALQELCPLQDEILDKVLNVLKKSQGSALFIDYGDFAKNRFKDTLQALYKHKRVNVLDHLGQADISHHVDFYYMKEYLKKKGFEHVQVTTQESFLKELGIEERLKAFVNNPAMTVQVARLIDPRHIGAIFKVLGFSSLNQSSLWGFQNVCQ